MGRMRYTEEYKKEAVRQITERGYPVSEVARNLGVAAWSLYKWVEKYSERKDSKKNNQIDELQKENLKLKREIKRIQEERDILKKAAAYFAKNSR